MLVALALPYMSESTTKGGGDPVRGLDDTLNQSLVVGVAKLMAAVGAFIGLAVANSKGRSTALWIVAVGYVLGPATLSVSENMGEIMIGRVLIGISIGSSAVVVPMYVAEMSSNIDRGKNVATYELLLATGTCFAAASDALLRPDWRKMMLVVIPFAAVLFVLSMFLLFESPRYLLEHDRKDEAIDVLKQLRVNDVDNGDHHQNNHHHGVSGGHSGNGIETRFSYESNMDQSISVQERKDSELERRAEKELNEIARAIDRHDAAAAAADDDDDNNNYKNNNNQSILEHAKRIVAKIKSLRSNANAYEATKILIALAAFNQLSGSTAVINYAPRLLAGGEGSEFDSIAHSTTFAISITITKLLGVAVGVYFVDCHDDEDEERNDEEEETKKKKFYGGRVSLLF